MVMYSSSSRSGSKRPDFTNGHCYPRPRPRCWDEDMAEYFEIIWERWLQIAKESPGLVDLPPQLCCNGTNWEDQISSEASTSEK